MRVDKYCNIQSRKVRKLQQTDRAARRKIDSVAFLLLLLMTANFLGQQANAPSITKI
jgi:hypothetical protein